MSTSYVGIGEIEAPQTTLPIIDAPEKFTVNFGLIAGARRS